MTRPDAPQAVVPRERDVAAVIAVVAQLVTRERALDSMLAKVAGVLTDALGADGCLVYLVEPNGQLAAAAGHPAHERTVELRLPAGFGVTGRVAADSIPVTLVDDNPRNPLHRQLLGLHDGERVSRLCVPARDADGRSVAVLAVHTRAHRRFVATEVALGQQVADLVGIRVRMAQAAASVATLREDWDGLVAATVAAQEAERGRVARDLHDGVSQAIAGLTFHLSAALVALGDGDAAYAAEQVRAARELADLAVGETRSAITGLRSPVIDDLGLAAGLVSMARNIPSLAVEVDAQELELPEHVVVSLFRIAQEALQNVVKHAGASKADVRLVRHARTVELSVTDDGCGFDISGDHLGGGDRFGGAGGRFGLAGMAERVRLIGGRITVTSQPGQGTRIDVTVPLP